MGHVQVKKVIDIPIINKKFLIAFTTILIINFNGPLNTISADKTIVINPNQSINALEFEAVVDGRFSYTINEFPVGILNVSIVINGFIHERQYSGVGGSADFRFSINDHITLIIKNIGNTTVTIKWKYEIEYDYLFSNVEWLFFIIVIIMSICVPFYLIYRRNKLKKKEIEEY